MAVAVVHPGDMGAAVGAALVASGHAVVWASAGRSEATRERAERAGLADAVTLDAAADRSDVVISICPPHAALDVARELAGFGGLYVDANAISPETAAEVAELVASGRRDFVDGGIIGRRRARRHDAALSVGRPAGRSRPCSTAACSRRASSPPTGPRPRR